MPAVHPLLRIHCPYCREKFHPGDCNIYSTVNSGKLLRAAPKPGSLEYTRSRVWVDELVGDFVLEKARRDCPRCHQLLFEGIETCDNINIAIVGDTGSGKTHYIAVLIDQLRRGIFTQSSNYRMRFMHLNEHTAETYQNEYYMPILRDRDAKLIKGTPRGVHDQDTGKPERLEPLVYQFSISDPQFPRPINLIFYDLAGEDIANGTSLVQFGEHILRADGIIYLADPLSMQSVRSQIPAELLTPPGRSPEEVLQTLSFHIERYTRTGAGGKIHIPTAIALSKFDLFQFVIPTRERPGLLLLQQPPYQGKISIAEQKRIDWEVRYCLRACHETRLEQESQGFSDVAFFAVSATGTPPDQQGIYDHVTPHRVLDPFTWLLWRLGYIAGI
jgi:hypothetical protein